MTRMHRISRLQELSAETFLAPRTNGHRRERLRSVLNCSHSSLYFAWKYSAASTIFLDFAQRGKGRRVRAEARYVITVARCGVCAHTSRPPRPAHRRCGLPLAAFTGCLLRLVGNRSAAARRRWDLNRRPRVSLTRCSTRVQNWLRGSGRPMLRTAASTSSSWRRWRQ
jgi:hypothetical protein